MMADFDSIGGSVLPRHPSPSAAVLREEAATLRRRAARVRELAQSLELEADRARVLRQAETIEAEAAALEERAAGSGRG